MNIIDATRPSTDTSLLSMIADDGRILFEIAADGTVTGEVATASEAGRAFADGLAGRLAMYRYAETLP